MPSDDQALRLKQTEGLVRGVPGDAVTLGEITQRGQLRTGKQAPGTDVGSQIVGDPSRRW
ncbi:hypothetical protein GCM10022252_60080 [Streptosporangium oxazolinicum]|uniref:Uncharacterized protein n=1 Tax=Streptosporangium oxazolinicum TaxID=909287 RepID=A0ABP8BBZ7_9ACTN